MSFLCFLPEVVCTYMCVRSRVCVLTPYSFCVLLCTRPEPGMGHLAIVLTLLSVSLKGQRLGFMTLPIPPRLRFDLFNPISLLMSTGVASSFAAVPLPQTAAENAL